MAARSASISIQSKTAGGAPGGPAAKEDVVNKKVATVVLKQEAPPAAKEAVAKKEDVDGEGEYEEDYGGNGNSQRHNSNFRPRCRNGKGCRHIRPGQRCKFYHPPTEQWCDYRENCRYIEDGTCPRRHPTKPCRFGDQCKRNTEEDNTCTYQHNPK